MTRSLGFGRRSFWIRLVALAGLVLGAGVASAGEPAATDAPDDDCVFFPDLRCRRSGRPEGFVKPIVTGYLFEDPFITTGIYSYFIWQDFPEGSALRGGEAYVASVQARVAITDRLAFIATKDGFAWTRPDEKILKNGEGPLDILVGFKYALVHDPERNLYLSPSLRMDIPVGEDDVYSGNGDGVFVPALSGAWGWDRFHLTGVLGGRLPIDRDKESTSIFYALQADVSLTDRISPFLVVSGSHWTDSGDGKRDIKLSGGGEVSLNTAERVQGVPGFEGGDVANLGSRGVRGHDVITMAWGARIRISQHLTFSAAYERPISNRKDLLRQRMTSSLAFEF